MTTSPSQPTRLAPKSPPRLITLILLTWLSVLSINMFLPSLANIAAAFEADYALVSLAIGGFLAMMAVLQLIIGPLSDRFGRRPVILVSLGVYVVASLGCLFATNVWAFLGFRMLQGVITAGWVISLTVIRDTSPEREAASRIGYITMAMAIAPMLAPMVGGVLDQMFGWRASFAVLAALGVIALILCWVDLGETNSTPSETFTRQFRSYPDLFASRRFWGFALCMAFSAAAFHVFLAGTPLVAGTVFDISAAELGIALGSITAGFMCGSFLSGRYAGRFPLTTMMISGRLVAVTGLVAGLVLFQAGIVHPLSLFGATIMVGFGNGLTMPSCNAGVLSVRPKLAGSASGLAGALGLGASAAFASLAGVVITEQNAVPALLGLMMLCALMGLLAALYVRWIDRREGQLVSAE